MRRAARQRLGRAASSIVTAAVARARRGGDGAGADVRDVLDARDCSTGMRVVGVPLREDFRSMPEAFLAGDARRRSPRSCASPTRTTRPATRLPGSRHRAASSARAPGLVVLDEAYHAVRAARRFMPRLAEFRNLVVMRTVSKLGLAGIRPGLSSRRGPEWIEQFNKVRSAVYNVNVLTQAAAIIHAASNWRCSRSRRRRCAPRASKAAAEALEARCRA